MKFKELKQKSEAELQKMLTEAREKVRDMRFKVSQRQLKKVRDIRKTKQMIAQILTILGGRKEDGKRNPSAPLGTGKEE